MSFHDIPLQSAIGNPGAVAVGDLSAMDGPRALCVMMFRDWFDGPGGRDRVRDVLVQTLGDGPGTSAAQDWSDLLEELTRHARRPLMHHDLSCRCVGADEAVLAQLLSLAACGAREEAMLILSLLMRADRTLAALDAAERAGCAAHRAALALVRTRPGKAVLH